MDLSFFVPLPPLQNYPSDFLSKKTNRQRPIKKIRFIDSNDVMEPFLTLMPIVGNKKIISDNV